MKKRPITSCIFADWIVTRNGKLRKKIMVQATPQEKSYRRKRQKTVFCCGIDASCYSIVTLSD